MSFSFFINSTYLANSSNFFLLTISSSATFLLSFFFSNIPNVTVFQALARKLPRNYSSTMSSSVYVGTSVTSLLILVFSYNPTIAARSH